MGKGGETIRQINLQTGAVLEITKDRSDCVGELKPVHIVSGTRAQLIAAKGMIDRIIAEQEQLNLEYQTGKKGPLLGKGKGKGKLGSRILPPVEGAHHLVVAVDLVRFIYELTAYFVWRLTT